MFFFEEEKTKEQIYDEFSDDEESISSTAYSSYSSAFFKQKSLKNKPSFKELKNYNFDDKEVFKVYMAAAEERQNVPRRSHERLNMLRKSDPEFHKQHRRFLYYKSCNKPPLFELNNTLNTPIMTKKCLVQRRHELIKENLPDSSKSNGQISNEKIKNFLDEFEFFWQFGMFFFFNFIHMFSVKIYLFFKGIFSLGQNYIMLNLC